MTDDEPVVGRLLCDPCKGEVREDDPRFNHLPDHEQCQGAAHWCECWTEVCIEAEEK